MKKYFIYTKHLGMRFITKGDSKYLQIIDKDPMVKKFFPEGTLTDEKISEFINECIVSCKNENLPCLVIFQLKDDDFVGEAYFGQLETGEFKIGYLLHEKYWNKGYATEILEALLTWAKNHIDTEYIIAFADIDNTASFRVMEKCGMKYYK
ncbi:TPA: GNAT family N-acetyltransferase, partial [Legionella pneumophila]|nr:GNAT family N-acetyltransferase [Legionella pneumophila]